MMGFAGASGALLQAASAQAAKHAAEAAKERGGGDGRGPRMIRA
jgi:hypothetical protein